MKVTEPLVQDIIRAIESVEYGSVEISLNEKGSFIEIIVKDRKRVEKDTYHLG